MNAWLNIALLVAITALYAGYNLFVKLSGNHVPSSATSTVLATIVLQAAALGISLLFLAALYFKGGHSFRLGFSVYQWAVLGGLCIGFAEIGYFYLFGGLTGGAPMRASIAIPAIVSGTIVITLVFSLLVLKEPVAWNQLLGCVLIVCGIVLFFVNSLSDG